MLYAILKGAGENTHSLNYISIRLYDSAQPTIEPEPTYYHNGCSKLTESTILEIRDHLRELVKQGVKIVGWGLYKYELRLIDRDHTLPTTHVIDMFTLLQLQRNQTVSFYKITSWGESGKSVPRYAHAALHGAVQAVPRVLAEKDNATIQVFLTDFSKALQKLFLAWSFDTEKFELSFDTKDGAFTVTLPPIFDIFDEVAEQVHALMILPRYAINLLFQIF